MFFGFCFPAGSLPREGGVDQLFVHRIIKTPRFVFVLGDISWL